jgi:hypothetical protein
MLGVRLLALATIAGLALLLVRSKPVRPAPEQGDRKTSGRTSLP